LVLSQPNSNIEPRRMLAKTVTSLDTLFAGCPQNLTFI
jgi:hypothetical protein